MKSFIVCGLLACAAVAAPTIALAQETETEQPEVADSDEPDPNAVRCESRPVTGSRARRQRICMTNAEWRRFWESGNADATRMLDNTTLDPASDGGP